MRIILIRFTCVNPLVLLDLVDNKKVSFWYRGDTHFTWISSPAFKKKEEG